ncbi:MAG: SHOCT domain-containing protein [Bacteriovorax sp.]|nr:SHOCT domain-containing protein [Rhizobacter sp.]
MSKAKGETVGGKALYDYGKKKCELYAFANKTVWLPEPMPVQQTASPVAPVEAAPSQVAVAPIAAPAPVVPPASSPAPQTQNETTATPVAEGSTARRLRELNELLKSGLITESEYKEKKKAILDSM